MAAATFQSDDSGVVKSPRSPSRSQSVSPPWTSIVKGPMVMASDAVSPAISSSVERQTGNRTSDLCSPSKVSEIVTSPDDSGTEGQPSGTGGGGGSNASMKPVWNKPADGVFEAVSPVMGAVSWPALGEFSKSATKSSSSESLKGLADGSLLPPLQEVTEYSSSSLHKQTTTTNAPVTSTQNHVTPAKHKSMKRGAGSFKLNPSANGGIFPKTSTHQNSVTENPQNAPGKPVTAPVESSPRNNNHIESVKGGGFGSQSVNGNDRQNQRNTYRRSNSGPHTRGDGSYHHNHSGKRDQDREWNQHSRSFNGRDNNAHSQRGYPKSYIRPPLQPAQFYPPQMPLLRPFGNNMMYPDLPSPMLYAQGPPPPPESLRGMPPFVGLIPPPMYFVSDPMLHGRIISQIDYYFSNENLVKDTFLRKNMDEQGWVPVSLIAGFKKVSYLTDNIQLILDAVRASTIVEVQGDKIRRRNDWMKWLMQPSVQTVGSQDVLASQLQGVSLDGAKSANQDSVGSKQGGGDVDNE